MISCNDLQSLDVSYCVTTELQARLLSDGIIEGLTIRMKRMLNVKPLQTIKIRGLDRLSSQISMGFRDKLKYLSKESDMSHTVNEHDSSACSDRDSCGDGYQSIQPFYGVENICTSGSNLCI